MDENQLEPIFVSIRTGSRITGLGYTKIHELINAGSIESRKIGGRRLLSYASLKRLGSEPREAA